MTSHIALATLPLAASVLVDAMCEVVDQPASYQSREEQRVQLAINFARALGGGYEVPPALANVNLK